jgi:hypothetical protein
MSDESDVGFDHRDGVFCTYTLDRLDGYGVYVYVEKMIMRYLATVGNS